MINGLVLLPKTEDYILNSNAIQITLDAVSMFPSAGAILVVRPGNETEVPYLLNIKYYENNVKTKTFHDYTQEDIIRIISSNRISGKLTVLVYAQGDRNVSLVTRNLYHAYKDEFAATFRNYFVDRVMETAKLIKSDAFLMWRRSQDMYTFRVNGRTFDVLDMASYAYVRKRCSRKLVNLHRVDSVGALLLHAVKPKDVTEDGNGSKHIHLKDGVEIVLYPNDRSIFEIIQGPEEKLEDSVDEPKYEGADVLGDAESLITEVEPSPQRKHMFDGCYLKPTERRDNIGVVKIQNSSLYGSRALEKVSDEQLSEIKDHMNGYGYDTFVPVTNMEYEALPEPLNESDYVIPTDKGEGTLIMEHQAGETHVKVYDNIGPEDAMPEVYTGSQLKDKPFLKALNHYRLDGSEKEKQLVEIIETKSINFDILHGTIARPTFRKFINCEPISDNAIHYAFKKLQNV